MIRYAPTGARHRPTPVREVIDRDQAIRGSDREEDLRRGGRERDDPSRCLYQGQDLAVIVGDGERIVRGGRR